jgi:cadmium resistance protein CadD (predicted permease)
MGILITLGILGLFTLILGLSMCILGKRDDRQMDRALREFLESEASK